jgi:hypothetical protein
MGSKFHTVAIVLTGLFIISVWVTVAYVIGHFIAKYW